MELNEGGGDLDGGGTGVACPDGDGDDDPGSGLLQGKSTSKISRIRGITLLKPGVGSKV